MPAPCPRPKVRPRGFGPVLLARTGGWSEPASPLPLRMHPRHRRRRRRPRPRGDNHAGLRHPGRLGRCRLRLLQGRRLLVGGNREGNTPERSAEIRSARVILAAQEHVKQAFAARRRLAPRRTAAVETRQAPDPGKEARAAQPPTAGLGSAGPRHGRIRSLRFSPSVTMVAGARCRTKAFYSSGPPPLLFFVFLPRAELLVPPLG